MNINFKRNRTQVKYEEILGISSIDELKTKRQVFLNYLLSDEETVNQLRKTLYLDAIDYLFNGMISLAEGLNNMIRNRYSWATVKLYYSIFYFLRASLAFNGYTLLQNQSIWRLKIEKGKKPEGSKNSKYASTHGGTINHYKDVFSGADILLTNKIDGIDVYQWMEEVRNIINYREVAFVDPRCIDFWDIFDEAIKNRNINEIVREIIDDESYVFCFQEEYAVVAIPLKRFMLTLNDFKENYEYIDFEDRIKYVDSIMPSELIDFVPSKKIECFLNNRYIP